MSDRHHQQMVTRSLAALGVAPGQTPEFEVLAGGASGANTYRIRLPQGERILKVAPPGSPRHVVERAHREIRFYEEVAARLSIAVPGVIARRRDDATGACLLLEALEPAPEPRDWTNALYIQAADLLGRLHAAFWGREGELATLRWLRQRGLPDQAEVRRARRAWARLNAEPRFEGVLTPDRYRSVLESLERIGGMERVPAPITLCHGDFHIGNILLGRDGSMVIADWQEVGPGSGPEDLSFFVQRAEFSGGTVPVEAMIGAWRRSLVAGIAEDIDIERIQRVMEIAELRTRLLHWPAYMADATERQLSAHLDRIETLVSRLGAAGISRASGRPGRG